MEVKKSIGNSPKTPDFLRFKFKKIKNPVSWGLENSLSTAPPFFRGQNPKKLIFWFFEKVDFSASRGGGWRKLHRKRVKCPPKSMFGDLKT